MSIKKSNAATLVDVAKAAGVSLKTASRVLNDSAHVSREKVARIKEVMKRLDYRPNELARGLKARKSAAIGMIVPNLADPFSASAVKAVQEVARQNGYVVVLSSSGGEEEIERAEIEILMRRQIDGLILAPAESRKDTFSHILPAHLPVVTFDQIIHGAKYETVTIHNRKGAREATQHLIDHKLRRIVAIGARPYLYTCSERLAGYRLAMNKAGLTPLPCLAQHESLLTPEWLVDEVFNRHKADAILSLNWVCTMLCLRGLRQLGKHFGKEVPFISFDDFDLAEMLTPGLSVVQQPTDDLGREAARLLFDKLNEKKKTPQQSIVLPAKLVLRGSCGCSGDASALNSHQHASKTLR